MDSANLQGVDFRRATVRNAQFPCAYLRDAGFREADLTQANLSGANLTNAVFVETNLTQATIIGCAVYGVAVWSPILEGAIQKDLVITNPDESTVTVDDLEIAQFLYLLLDNKKLRNILQTVTSKTVLILGRFTPERKRILDALREELRKFDLVPVIFDFDKPPSQELSETVDTLAGLARFLIADLTDPCSIPAELQRIVPLRSSLPVLPIIQESQQPYALFAGFRNYPWVLPTHIYRTLDDLLRSVPEKVIAPLIAKSRELAANA
jgi:Pentapeptide repeats (8 copies)